MGDLIWSIVPLVALVVWILANLFGAKEDQPQRPAGRQRQPQARPAPRRAPREKGLTELDRFLGDIAKEEERKAKRKEVVKPPPLPQAQPPREPKRRPSWESQPSPAATAVPPAPRVRPLRVETPIEGIPVLKVVEEEQRVPKRAPLHDIASEAVDAAEQKRVRQMARRKPSAAAERLVAMLTDPETVQTAVLMREVLDRPRAFAPYRRIV